MNEHAKQATAHRKRSEQLRTIAIGIKNEEHRRELLRIADDFDRLADMRDRARST